MRHRLSTTNNIETVLPITASIALGLLLLLVQPAAAQERPTGQKGRQPAGRDADKLELKNPGFEDGKKAVAGWEEGAAIDGVEYIWDRDTGHKSESSLGIRKTVKRYFPIAQWRQTVVNSGETSKLKLAAWVKAEKMHKAILDVGFLHKDGKETHQWAAYIGAKKKDDPPADHDWKEYSGVVAIPKDTKRISIRLQVYGPGAVWFDDVSARYVADDTPASLYDEKGKPRRERKP